MNWLKVGAVVVGGIIVFFVVDSLVHVFLGLLTAIAFVAIVAGGAYVAFKIAGARRRRQVRRGPRQRQAVRHAAEREEPTVVVPRSAAQPAPTAARPAPTAAQPARHDVEDDLARLKREMGG